MNAQTDSQLLHAYAERRVEAAFTELVRRYVNLVYSAARRMVRDQHLSEDVTQAVFAALAKNAAQLADRPVLSVWLHRTAQNIAAQTVRTDVRRRAREQEAATMKELPATEADPLWDQIQPHLDAALVELSEPDRAAVMLRYFEGKSAREMALSLGTTEEAAQRRVSRAVERLRECLAGRGLAVGAGGLVVVLSANAVQAAPAGLGAAIAAAALAGPSAGAVALTTATKTIAMTTLQKAAIAATLAIVAAAGIQKAYEASQLRDQVQMLQQQQKPLAGQIQQLQRERDDVTHRLASLKDEKSPDTELLRLRAEVTALRQAARERATTESTAVLWANRIALLKQSLDQMPDKRIPEMEFLADKDWAAATRDADLSTDDGVRQAMRALRSAAKDNFLKAMRDAMKKYAAAANGGDLPGDSAQLAQAVNANAALLPSDLAQLKPYFDVPVEDATLQRYQFRRPGKVHDNLSDVLVNEIAPPADTEYDTHHEMGLYSGGVGNVNLIADAVAAAARDYAQANNGQMPGDPAQIARYLKQPLEAALVQKYLPKFPADAAVPGK